jgi:hypothetical protein
LLKLPLKELVSFSGEVAKHLKVSTKIVQDVIDFQMQQMKAFIDDPTHFLPHVGIKFNNVGAFKVELGRINSYLMYVLIPHMRSLKASKSSSYAKDCETFRRLWLLRQFLIQQSQKTRPYDKRVKSVINEKTSRRKGDESRRTL